MKDFRSIICREAPDTASGPAATDPAAAADAAAAQAAAAAAAPQANDGGNPPDPAPAAPPAKKDSPWYLSRISEEAAARRAAESELEALRKRAADAEALASRLQQGQGGNPPAPHQAPPVDETERQRAIRVEAENMRFAEDTADVAARGRAEFGASFQDTIGVLNAVTGGGRVLDDLCRDVLAIDKASAHQILKQIADDPERAANMARMDSRRRIAELTKMSIAATKAADPAPKPNDPPARQVSKAPAPPPPVTPSATKTPAVYSDELSDEEFTRQFNERQAARKARR